MKEKRDKDFIHKVLVYWKKHGRHDLPWRKQITPYRILVSEIMLQQTQVSRVKEKFVSWMEQFKTLTSLRESSLQDVLILWQGLGYQRRAKALFTIARKVRVIPKDVHELVELPGVGMYTASALCAFAYNTFAHPLLETNIRTAIIEEFCNNNNVIDDDILYNHLRRLETYTEVKKVGARVWYFALMDYGAYLKMNFISHNARVKGYTKQKPFKGSLRELRAKTLFAITHKSAIPKDTRIKEVLGALQKEGYIAKSKKGYTVI